MKLQTIVLSACCAIVFFNPAQLLAASAPNLSQAAELTPSDGGPKDAFGVSVAISGGTVVVGEFNANTQTTGSAYVYVEPASGWTDMTQVAKLAPSDGGEGFGTAVAIAGNVIVVGAANASNLFQPESGPGAAYVFVKPSGGWTDMTETAKLTASDGQPGDAFGYSVSISDATVAVGAIFAADSSGNSFAGKAYVFARPGSRWHGALTETAKLTASDSQLLNYMGASVAVGRKTVVVGAYGHNNFQGAGYVFVKAPSGWSDMTQTAELSTGKGKGGDFVGFSAALIGRTAVLGAPGASQGKGRAYAFVEHRGGWVNMNQTAELNGANSIAGDSFGQAVSVSTSRIVVGAPGVTVNGSFGQGAFYSFFKPRSGWKNSSRALEFTASDGVGNDNFGLCTGLSDKTVATGSVGNNNPGAAYVFAN
jgi:FG-GAP repeat protein